MPPMSMPTHDEGTTPEETVEGFLEALRSGRILDALDVFSMKAVIRDPRGREHRGIREIVNYVNRLPRTLEIEELRRDGDAVMAIVRSGRDDRARHTYALDRGRIQALRIEGMRS